MDLCTTLVIIWDCFTTALQGSQFRHFHNIIFDIHEDDIPSNDASGGALITQKNKTIKRDRRFSEGFQTHR